MRATTSPGMSLWDKVQCPGLTPSAGEVLRLVKEIPRKAAAFHYKSSAGVVWVVFIGGTGTGKSTLFNALCGKHLSETGVERPKTYGPIAYAHRDALIEKGFPFDSMKIQRVQRGPSGAAASTGSAGRLLIAEHSREDLAHLVLVDTPDLDSLELQNRRMVEELYLLAHVVVFVTSQEKYADDVPFQFLGRIRKDAKSYFLLLNKAQEDSIPGDVLAVFREQGVELSGDRFHVLPYLRSDISAKILEEPGFSEFRRVFFQALSRQNGLNLLREERKRDREKGKEEFRLLLDHLKNERLAAQGWLDRLDVFFRSACRVLHEKQEEHLNEETRAYLQRQVRDTFAEYDLLRKPRRFISDIIRMPLRFLGIVGERAQESREEALARIRGRIDLLPIHAAIENFNRSVLEKLSPADPTAPLFEHLRAEGVALTDEEIGKAVEEEQDELVGWLERTFQDLARGIPKSKEWGIYSTSILWGGLILALETAIGGGISIMEAVLDSAIAPFVTKGAVELFAYRELQKIARELGKRYQEGLISVVRRQKERYAGCLESLMTSDETIQGLRNLEKDLWGDS